MTLDLYQLSFQLETITAEIVEIDGFLFINNLAKPRDELLAQIASHESITEAQYWMNIVLLDGFITEAVGDEWTDDDPSVDRILSVFSQAWSYQIRAKYPAATYSITKCSDQEYGDLGLRLLGKGIHQPPEGLAKPLKSD